MVAGNERDGGTVAQKFDGVFDFPGGEACALVDDVLLHAVNLRLWGGRPYCFCKDRQQAEAFNFADGESQLMYDITCG